MLYQRECVPCLLHPFNIRRLARQRNSPASPPSTLDRLVQFLHMYLICVVRSILDDVCYKRLDAVITSDTHCTQPPKLDVVCR